LINLLREHDPLLNEHLNTSTVFRRKSLIVQNDIVHLLISQLSKQQANWELMQQKDASIQDTQTNLELTW